MKSLCVLAALAMVVLPVTVQASEVADYSDKTAWPCDKATIEPELSNLVEDSPLGKIGTRLLYVTDEITETARSKTELRCHVVAVLNNGNRVPGIFRLVNQDGHELVGFQAGKVR